MPPHSVQYWDGKDAHFPIEDGAWRDFPIGAHRGNGGLRTLSLAQTPQQVVYVRILMTADSDTVPAGSTDVRDRLGYAVDELYLGRTEGGSFVDEIAHEPLRQQTTMVTSSTDPWHLASDIDRNYEHIGFERLFAGGIANGQPMMVPVPVLYGTPEDAAVLVRYLRTRTFPVKRIEMGEEPEGQLAEPETYASLYLQVAKAINAVAPDIERGGPATRPPCRNGCTGPTRRARSPGRRGSRPTSAIAEPWGTSISSPSSGIRSMTSAPTMPNHSPSIPNSSRISSAVRKSMAFRRTIPK
jgi:hypothetical protein